MTQAGHKVKRNVSVGGIEKSLRSIIAPSSLQVCRMKAMGTCLFYKFRMALKFWSHSLASESH